MGKPEIKYKLSTLALLAATPGLAIAGPQGGNVVAGAATISTPTPQGTVIDQGSAKAIINWQSFSIGSTEYVQFNQPDSSSISLNRVVGVDPSVILGNLTANGQVFLVNPNGVLFGTGATLDVGGLVASTLDIDNDDFLNGNYIFTSAESSAGNAVVNAGVIQARESGYVVLMGDRVENNGNVETKFGQIALLAGGEVTLDIGGDGLLSYSIDSASAAELAGVENTGELIADGGRVILAGKVSDTLVATAVNNSGLIQANGIEERNGEIYLTGSGDVYNSGTINASGETGGTVSIQGKRVAQQGEIHADGSIGDGGNVSITADEVIALTNGSVTTANAGTNGDGGEVIAYTEGSALLRDGATIEAKGGSESGDGGFVEVSGIQHIEINGFVDATAENGVAGTFLIDPTDINIVADATDGDPDLTDTNMDNVFENDTTGVNEIEVGVITDILDMGTSVTLQTTNAVDNSPMNLGDITVDTTISTNIGGDGDATLTLQADNDIILNENITNGTGTLNVDFQAGNNVDLNADIDSNGGNVTLLAGNDVTFDSVTDINSSNGTIDIMSTVGDITMASGSNVNAGSGAVILTAGTDVAIAQINTSGSVDITASAGEITDAQMGEGSGNENITGGTVTLTASTGIGVSGSDIDTNVETSLSVTTTTGGIDIVDSGDLTVSAASTTTSGDVIINAANSLGITGAISAAGTDDVDLSSDGSISIAGTVTVTGNGTVDIVANGTDSDVTLEANITSDSGTITINADDSINFTATGAITSTSGDVDVIADVNTSAGDDGDVITMADGAAINAGSGLINLETEGNITVGQLITTDTSTTSVQLTSNNGSILDAGDTGGADVTSGGRLAIRSETGVVGLETDITSLDVTNDSSGDIVITETDALTINNIEQSTAGNVDITATGNIALGQVITSGTISIEATGAAITDDNGNTDNVIGSTVTLTAGTGIGTAGDQIETDADTLSLSSTTGGIYIDENDAVTIANAIASTSGDIDISAAGDITVSDGNDGAATTVIQTAGTGTISLDASGMNDDIDVRDAIQSDSGSISLTASNDIVSFTGDGDITSTSGMVTVTSDNITMATDTVINAGSGAIDLNADTDVALGQLTTSSTVNVDATGGAITDVNGTANNVTGSTVTLIADDGIGTLADALETAATSLDMDVTNTGDINIDQTGDVIIAKADTSDGSLTISGSGAITTAVTLDADDGISLSGASVGVGNLASANGTVSVSADTGDITLGAVNAGAISITNTGTMSGNITTGQIDVDNGDVDIDADGAVLTTNINASNAINVSGSEITTGNLDATDAGVDLTSTSGAINVGTISVDSADGTDTSVTADAATTLTVGDITATSDAVDLSAGTTMSLAEITGASDIGFSAGGTVTSSAATAYTADSISLIGTGGGASYSLNTDTAQLNLQGGINSLVLSNTAFNGTTSNIAVSGSGYGSLDIDTDVNTDLTGALSATGVIDINSEMGDLTINNDVSTTSTLTLTGAAIDSSAATLSGDSGLTLTGDSVNAGALNADTGIVTVTANTGNVATTAITADSISITANDAMNGAITTGALTTDVGSISLVSEGDVSTGSNAVSSATTVNLDGANITAGDVSGTTVTLDGANINVGSITSSAGLNVLNADDFTAGDIDSGGLGLTVNTTTSIDTQAITNTAAVALTSTTIGTGDISGTTVLLDGTTIDTGAITASSGLSISNANDFTATGTIDNGGSALSISTNNSIDTQNIINTASVTLTSDTVSTGDLTATTGNVVVTANDGTASTGSITANSGSVNVSATNGATTIVGDVNAGTGITLSGAGVTASMNGDLTTTSGDILVNVPAGDANGIMLGDLSAASGTVSVDADLGDATVGTVNAISGTISGEDVTVGSVTGNIGVMASNLTLDGTYANGTFSATNTLTLDTAGIINNNNVSLTGTNVNVDGTINALATGAEQNASVTINATNDISISGTVNVLSQSGNATFTATADSDGDMSGDFTQTATGAVTVTASNTLLGSPIPESGTGDTNINIAGANVQQLGSLTSNAANGTSAILIPGNPELFIPDLYLTTGSVANQSSINLTSTTGSVETNTITSNYSADTVFGEITGSESISINSATGVTVNGAIQTSNTASTEMVSIMAAGNVAGAGSLASDSVSITTTGDIGSVSDSLNIDASSVVISGSLSNAWLGLDRATSSLTLNSGVSDLLDVTAAGNLNLDGTLTASDIVLNVAGDASDGGNVLTANSVSLNGAGNYGTTGTRFDIDAAAINIDEAVNSAALNSSAAATGLNFVNTGHGDIDVTGSSDLSVTGAAAISANTVTINTSGSLDVQQDLSTTNPLVLTANGITSGTNVLTASSISLNGTGSSNINVDTDAATVVLGTGLADVDVDNGANTAATIFNFGAGSYGALTLNAGGDTSFAGSNITTSGDVDVMSAGALDINRSIIVNTGADANLSLTATGTLTQQVNSNLTATAGANAGDSATITLTGSSIVQDGIVVVNGGGAGGTNTIDLNSTIGNIEASILSATASNGNNAIVDVNSAAGVTFDTFSSFGIGIIQAVANNGNDAMVNVSAATTVTQNAGNNIATSAGADSAIDINASGAVQLDGAVDADNVAGTSTIDVTGSGYTGTAILDANNVAITTTGGAIDARTRSADITLAGTDTLTLDNTTFTGATTFNYTQSSYNTLDLSFGGTTTLVGSDITTSGATSISGLAGLNLNQGYNAPVINLTAGGQVNVAGLLNAATINFDGNGGANFGSSGSKIMTNANTVDLGAGISDVFIDNEMNTGNATLNFSGANYGIVDFDFGGNSASSGMGVTTTSNVTGNDFLASALAISGNGNINVTAGFDVNGGTVPGVDGDTLLTSAVASVSGIINDGGSSDPNASFIATDKLTLNVSNLKQSNQYVLAKADDIQFTGTSNAENLLVQLTPFSSGADIFGNFKSLSFNQTASGAADFNYGFDEHFAPFTGTTIALGEQGFGGDISVGLVNAGTKNLIFLTGGAISGLDNIIGSGLLGTADETGGFFVVRPIVTTFTADQLGSFGFRFGARVATIELNNGFDASGEDERNKDDLELEEGGVNDGSEQQCS